MDFQEHSTQDVSFDRSQDRLKPLGETTTQDKRLSLVLATVLYALLILVLFFIRFWPPSDKEMAALIAGGGGGGGVTVNFGDSDFGSGSDYRNDDLNVTNQKATATPTPEESLLTDDSDAAPDEVVVPKNEPTKKPVTPTNLPIKTTKPKEVKQPVRKVDDALANILKGGNRGGDGDDAAGGNKGKTNGSLGSNGYYGSGGSGGGTGGGNGPGNGTGTGPGSGSGTGGGNGSGNGRGNGPGYELAGRKALNKPQPAYTCNEEGTVVVQITVDKNGNVIDAKPGARGTTNSASCLASQAKIAAMQTKWSASPDGAERQVGKITYNFKLTE
ncbi:energy transducer TonB [Flavobacterium sp.]|uniref:energy transducer TonB family protein n=1 Tax=Flavobacterium sp. TaxID=239 RepID=UPI00333FA3DA